MRANLEDNKTQGLWIKDAIRGDLLQAAISAAFTVPAKPPFIVNLDATGAQNVTCPAKGSRFIFLLISKGTNAVALTVKDSLGVTIGTVPQGKVALVIDDGVATVCGAMT